jgi:GMP synthase (glutamine-hydrolysing)
MRNPRILVVEGNPRASREALIAAGARVTADLYVATLGKVVPQATCDVVRPTDADATLPAGAALAAYDGIAWTGSSLNVYNRMPEVERQIALMRACLASKVPVFGSCWGLQVAAAVAGGTVELNPRGREYGIARKIAKTAAGRAHPMLAAKDDVYDALCIHKDEVTRLPPGAVVLSANTMSQVQATAFTHEGGLFWGVQYHPEYDIAEVGLMARRYPDAMVAEGFFADREAIECWVGLTGTLAADPGRRDLAWLIGAGPDVLDEGIRLAELRNWAEQVVLARVPAVADM